MSMRSPLYKPESPEQAPYLGDHGNAGLWYDKFCDRWIDHSEPGGLPFWSLASSGGNQEGDAGPKLDWIKTVCKRVGDSNDLEDAVQRLYNLVAYQAGFAIAAKTVDRFVSGLGREHPVENGFAWHHGLGVPYLPGSSVKGVTLAWARDWQGAQPAELDRIFGPPPGGDGTEPESGRVGSVVFLDALPTGPVRLEPEVMTPHYSDYYQADPEDEMAVPGDWLNPVPIPFLAVARGQEFLFSVMPRLPRSDRDRSDANKAADWLSEALINLGGGAKTAVGFGRFTIDPKALRVFEEAFNNKKKAKQGEQDAATKSKGKSRMAQALIQDIWAGDWRNDKQACLNPPGLWEWIDKLFAAPDFDTLQLICELFDKHFQGLRANPSKAKKERQKATAERLNDLEKRLIASASAGAKDID